MSVQIHIIFLVKTVREFDKRCSFHVCDHIFPIKLILIEHIEDVAVKVDDASDRDAAVKKVYMLKRGSLSVPELWW